MANRHLAEAGLSARVDPRPHDVQAIEALRKGDIDHAEDLMRTPSPKLTPKEWSDRHSPDAAERPSRIRAWQQTQKDNLEWDRTCQARRRASARE